MIIIIITMILIITITPAEMSSCKIAGYMQVSIAEPAQRLLVVLQNPLGVRLFGPYLEHVRLCLEYLQGLSDFSRQSRRLTQKKAGGEGWRKGEGPGLCTSSKDLFAMMWSARLLRSMSFLQEGLFESG